MSTLVTAFGRAPEAITVPSTLSMPLPDAGRDVTFTLDRAAPASVSEKLKLAAVNG